jgi:peptide/nickel transport system substrate-binding protein
MHSNGDYASAQGYSNPRVDELIEKGIAEINPDKRKEIYYELQRLYFEDVPSFIIDQGLGRHWARDWVKGWYYNPIYPGAPLSTYFYDLWKGY